MKILFVLLLSLATSRAVQLSWNTLDHPEVIGYNVHYGTNATAPSQHLTLGKVTTTDVGGLAAGSTVYFVCNGRTATGNESGPSNKVTYVVPAATPSPTPAPPVVSFSLSWNAVTYATKYRVYEGTTQIAEQTGTTFSLAGKVGPKSYQVCGVNSAGVLGPKSNTVSLAAPTPTPTPTPTPAAPVLQLLSP